MMLNRKFSKSETNLKAGHVVSEEDREAALRKKSEKIRRHKTQKDHSHHHHDSEKESGHPSRKAEKAGKDGENNARSNSEPTSSHGSPRRDEKTFRKENGEKATARKGSVDKAVSPRKESSQFRPHSNSDASVDSKKMARKKHGSSKRTIVSNTSTRAHQPQLSDSTPAKYATSESKKGDFSPRLSRSEQNNPTTITEALGEDD